MNEQGFQHTDVRWPNIVYDASRNRYLLTDFENIKRIDKSDLKSLAYDLINIRGENSTTLEAGLAQLFENVLVKNGFKECDGFKKLNEDFNKKRNEIKVLFESEVNQQTRAKRPRATIKTSAEQKISNVLKEIYDDLC